MGRIYLTKQSDEILVMCFGVAETNVSIEQRLTVENDFFSSVGLADSITGHTVVCLCVSVSVL